MISITRKESVGWNDVDIILNITLNVTFEVGQYYVCPVIVMDTVGNAKQGKGEVACGNLAACHSAIQLAPSFLSFFDYHQ